ncbi:MAG TPA: hypothetical protein VJQ54_23925 [Candidatus Sulfotelmatobacter sp.]|nr:hypothetical protein [Candidatus Sulfotelmatobacter sp.]
MRLYALVFLCFLIFTVPTHAQWDLEDSHTTASLRGIHNLGGGVAWASGTDGTVLRTEDGGYLWQTCALPPGAEHLDFRGIQAFDENTAIVMSSGKGDLSRLYKTRDGCKTWKLVLANPDKDGFWDAIRFDFRKPFHSSSSWREHTHGVLVGDPVDGNFVIYETSNSGDTWRRWPNDKSARPAKASAKEAIFAASNSALIAPGVNGPFAFVTGGEGGAHLFIPEPHSPFDNGTTWKFSEITLPLTSGDSAGAFSIAARLTRNQLSPDLMIVGGDYKKPNAMEGNAIFIPFRVPAAALVSDLLQSRVLKPSTPPHGYRSAVAYDQKTKTWITVGPNGTDISTDDGKNWRALKPKSDQSTDADTNWNALSLPFVVGPKGRIGKLRADALKP